MRSGTAHPRPHPLCLAPQLGPWLARRIDHRVGQGSGQQGRLLPRQVGGRFVEETLAGSLSIGQINALFYESGKYRKTTEVSITWGFGPKAGLFGRASELCSVDYDEFSGVKRQETKRDCRLGSGTGLKRGVGVKSGRFEEIEASCG